MPITSTLQPWSDDLTELLHFDQVLAEIAKHCLMAAGRELVAALRPIPDPPIRAAHLDATRELVHLLEGHQAPPLALVDDLRPTLSGRDKGGAPLSADEFGSLRTLLLVSGQVAGFFETQEACSHWRSLSPQLIPWEDGPQAIDEIIDEDLIVRDAASPALRKVRQSIRRKERTARDKLNALHAKAMESGWGQAEPLAWRDGRLVIALKASHKRKIKGLIHDYSSSGATAFVEPLAIFDINNEIANLREEEAAEILRLLTALTDLLRPFMPSVMACQEILHRLDMHLAIAHWAHDLGATDPAFSTDGRLDLTAAINPILAQRREVVPLNLTLGPADRLLLISGPNAGGKTVVLLTVGLLAMMAHSGLPVPARDALFPELRGIYADLGDRQSLEHDLSTFSAHLTNLRDIAAACGPGTLVLLDELGTGTEPESGAALGQSFLETIRERGALCLVTTHLNRLKVWGQSEAGVISGAMSFDPDALEPTFELRLHQPGASYALEIAQRLGLDKAILERARDLMPDSALELEDLLVTLQTQRAALDKQADALARRTADINAREKMVTGKEEQLAKVRRRAEKAAVAEARQLVDGVNGRLERVIAEIRERDQELTADDIRKARGVVAAISADLQNRDRALKTAAPQPLGPDDLQPGTWVEVLSQGRKGEIVQVSRNGKKVTVSIGDTRVIVPSDQLAAADPPAQSHATPVPQTLVSTGGDVGYQLDLRGVRGDEAMQQLDRFLDRAILAGLQEVEIIHGKGTGVLQTLVHESLAEHPQVAEFHFADFDAGGTGATLATLK